MKEALMKFIEEFPAEWEIFMAKLLMFFEKAKEAPMLMWEQTASEPGNRLMLIMFALGFVGGALYLVVAFLKAGWKEKLRMLLVGTAVVLVLLVIFWFALKDIDGYKLPDAEEVSLGEETGQKYPQYSLVRGDTNSLSGSVGYRWAFVDDMISWRLNDGLVLQLSDIHDLPGEGRYTVNNMRREANACVVSLSKNEGALKPGDVSEGKYWHGQTIVELFVEPGRNMVARPWYGESGDSFTRDGNEYTVMENDGDSVSFLVKDGWFQGDFQMTGVGLGRQFGNDTVYAVMHGYRIDGSNDGEEASNFDPAVDEALCASFLETLEIFMDNVSLVKVRSDEEAAEFLPDFIVDYPAADSSEYGGFKIPCDELIEFVERDGSFYLKFTAADPEGEQREYTLVNGGAEYRYGNESDYGSWRDAFEAGKENPDKEMSEFFGAVAVEYEGGWIFNPGYFIGENNIHGENYFYLSSGDIR